MQRIRYLKQIASRISERLILGEMAIKRCFWFLQDLGAATYLSVTLV